MLPHPALLDYTIDEVIETLPLKQDKRREVGKSLMTLAPTACQHPGVLLTTIWNQLTPDIQNAINEAAHKEWQNALSYEDA